MDIQVWSDVVCPWCYIGKTRLEKALADYPGEVTVDYRAFQLDPAPVPHPIPVKVAVGGTFGRADQAEQMFARVAAIGAGDGLVLDFDRSVTANTFDAHRLIAWAAGQGRQVDMLNALYQAHFADGVDVGSRPSLARIAGSIRLDQAAALAYLNSGAGADHVNADLDEAAALGITSVPTFVINSRFALQGAQEAPVLRDALDEIERRERVEAAR